MRKFKPLLHAHQESMGRQVKDTLDDYSGIIHTLPMLVKMHEEAMDVFNSSREKDSVSYLARPYCLSLSLPFPLSPSRPPPPSCIQ